MLRQLWIAGVAWIVAGSAAIACPFCSAVSQTLSEEIASMDAVVIAELVRLPKPSSDPNAAPPKATFRIREVLKGDTLIGDHKELTLLFYGKAKPGELFMIQGVDPPQLMWSTPLKLSKRAMDYVRRLPQLPAKGRDRVAFFWKYLEDEDDLLARDAYDEFARASFEDVLAAKDVYQHDQLVKWIEDKDIPVSRRRLYFTLLGACGSKADNPLLERLLRSSDKQDKAGLDALAACYLTINGADGLPLLEELYLTNPDVEYVETYSVIQAIRFHGTTTDRIPRERLLASLRLVLDRPPVADLVIPDLARWEDWSQIDRLAELFRKADEKTSWVRVPIVNYLMACPLPEAKKTLAELEKIDPGAVRRAKTFMSLGSGSSGTSNGK